MKPYGIRVGILVADAADRLYLLRFDPPGYLGLATGAEVVASKLFFALGYNVTENYIVDFQRDQLLLAEGAQGVTSMGDQRELLDTDVDNFLDDVARDPLSGYRAVATLVPGSWEGLLGPYQVFGTRSDDPNDIVPHEHRRDQRGLFVFASWLNHFRIQAATTLDVVVTENDVPFIRHYLIDFTGALGSAGDEPKKARHGNERRYDFGQTFKNVAGMGIYTPRWMRARYPHYPAAGHFEYDTFEPERWTSNDVIAPFANRLPDDTFWAARQLATFTDEDIATIVSTGRYNEPATEAWIVKCLVERRNTIIETYFEQVLPLDRFEIVGDELKFVDLGVTHGLVTSRDYSVTWATFDNVAETHQQMGTAAPTFDAPPTSRSSADGSYFAAGITAGDPELGVTVYVRKEPDGLKVVGVDRFWPDKVIAEPSLEVDAGRSRYTDLEPAQQHLFEGYTESYNESTELDLTPEEYFNSLMIAEGTTYDAVTHALIKSELTDENEKSLGSAIDLVDGIERVAGQYYGRAGDQQFRLYVFLKPGARETLETSREFALSHLNTVYHVGYPYSYRQGGKLPSIQFSVSEDNIKADIDVDYRSSKMPASLFNGHLTSANSDVRAGDNYERHNTRWAGHVAWWRDVFGRITHHDRNESEDLLFKERPEPPTTLPPNRPAGTEPAELQDAIQEFLTDWLVRRNVDEAARFISAQTLACVDTDDDVADEVLEGEQAADLLIESMRALNDELGERPTLTQAIDAVLPWAQKPRIREHPWSGDFTLGEMTDAHASIYLCGREVTGDEAETYGNYYGVLFRFKLEGSAVLGLLWSKENGNWRLVSYEAFEQ